MTTHLELTQQELRLLSQSLDHCLATCHQKGTSPDQPCEDCDQARKLLAKVRKELKL
jgi:hypothetical protein